MGEEKFYSYSVDEQEPQATSAVADGIGSHAADRSMPLLSRNSNGDISSRHESSLLSHSDSGGFNSHKFDSVVAVANSVSPRNRESMLLSQEDPANSTDLLDKQNGNSVFYAATAASSGGGASFLETMM